MLILIAIICFVVGSMAFQQNKRIEGGSDGWMACTIIFCVLSVCAVIVLCIISIIWLYYIEELQRLDDSEVIAEEQYQRIAPEITRILAQYSPHEQTVFANISPDKFNAAITLYAVTYPELKANEVFQDLTAQVSALLTTVYQFKLNRARIQRNMRTFQRLFIFIR